MILKRPLCIATVFYILGIIMGLYIKIDIVFFLLLISMVIIVIYFIVDYIFKILLICKKKSFYKIGLLLVLTLFAGIVSIRLVDRNFEKQYETLKQREIYLIKAIVVSGPIQKEYKTIYEIEVREINGEKSSKGIRYFLNVKNSKKSNIQDLEYGDFIEFNGAIEKPSTARNYMGFNYQIYLKTKKICGDIFVNDSVKILAKDKSEILDKFFYNIATDIKNKIYNLLPEDVKEVCVGILIGERNELKEELSTSFRSSNLTHMLAVSGAHVSYIILGISMILRKTAKRFSKVFTIAFLLLFMGITKFTPSVERASIMAILLLFSSLFHRKADVYTNLSLSAIIILVHNPYAILNIGFQLSYGGTIGIILLHRRISNWIYQRIHFNKTIPMQKNCATKKSIIYIQKLFRYVIDMLIVTFSANLIIIPIMMYHFNTVSFTFWISNVLAGPFLGCIIILGFITYFISILLIPLAQIVVLPLQCFIQLLILIAKICEKLPFSSVMTKTPYIFEIILYYFVIYILFHLQRITVLLEIFWKSIKRKAKRRDIIKTNLFKLIVISVMICCVISYIWFTNRSHNLRLYFVDVGQGDCMLISTPSNKTMLIDGGGSETGSFDVGKQILLPYLLDRRITKIDYIMISHFDSDHIRSDY